MLESEKRKSEAREVLDYERRKQRDETEAREVLESEKSNQRRERCLIKRVQVRNTSEEYASVMRTQAREEGEV